VIAGILLIRIASGYFSLHEIEAFEHLRQIEWRIGIGSSRLPRRRIVAEQPRGAFVIPTPKGDDSAPVTRHFQATAPHHVGRRLRRFPREENSGHPKEQDQLNSDSEFKSAYSGIR
jgi:hypothetical protein